MHAINPYVPIIILTAHGSIESAVEAIKKGAFNFLNKPFDPEELLLQIEKAMENRRLISEVRRLEGLLKERYDFKNIVAQKRKDAEGPGPGIPYRREPTRPSISRERAAPARR